MHKAIRTHLKSVETGGPDETTYGCIAFRLTERVVDRAICDLVIALDILSRNCIHFTAGRYSDSGGDKSLHLPHAGSICEQPVPQFARSCAERGQCAHAGDYYATLV